MSTIPSLDVANTARAEARYTRARQLIRIAEGETTVTDTLRAATVDAGRPLLRITLKQLLMAQPGWGEQKTSHVLNKTQLLVGSTKLPTRKLTIAWVLDPRAGGRRFMAFCDALAPNSTAPWPGFPFAPRTNRTATETDK